MSYRLVLFGGESSNENNEASPLTKRQQKPPEVSTNYVLYTIPAYPTIEQNSPIVAQIKEGDVQLPIISSCGFFSPRQRNNIITSVVTSTCVINNCVPVRLLSNTVLLRSPWKMRRTYQTFTNVSRTHHRRLHRELVPSTSTASTTPNGGSNTNTMRPSLSSMLLIGTTIGGSCYCLVFLGNRHHKPLVTSINTDVNWKHHHRTTLPTALLATSAKNLADDELHNKQSMSRTFSTRADAYFQEHKKIPLPPIIHDNLGRMLSDDEKIVNPLNSANSKCTDKILLIGDIHGCLDELKALVSKATDEHNNGKQFKAIVLVGDLCNKGPYSAQVIEYVRNQLHWYAVRGNHDDRALAAAFGDETCLAKPKYDWVKVLTDEDVVWMANLPYTIRIPKGLLMEETEQHMNNTSMSSGHDVIVVHAGLIPNVDLEEQKLKTMLTVRDLIPIPRREDDSTTQHYKYYKNSSNADESPIPWVAAWHGPELIVFGHDAKRGIQLEEFAIGLDSGCVYGKKLTGLILPEKKLVSVDAMEVYCPI